MSVVETVVTPTRLQKIFSRSDRRLRRIKPDEVIGAGTRLQFNASQWHRLEAARRWALKKTRRLAGGKAFAYERPQFSEYRDVRNRETLIVMDWAYAIIDRPDGEVWVVEELNG